MVTDRILFFWYHFQWLNTIKEVFVQNQPKKRSNFSTILLCFQIPLKSVHMNILSICLQRTLKDLCEHIQHTFEHIRHAFFYWFH